MPAPASDREFLGLHVRDATSASFVLDRHLVRPDGRLYGGTAVAVAVALAEEATDRVPIWTTVQFVRADTQLGQQIECTTEVLNLGRRTAQVRVTGRIDGAEVFCALGATGTHKDGGLQGTMEHCPRVLPPDSSPRFKFKMPAHLEALGIGVDTTGVDGSNEIRIAVADEDYEFTPDEVVLWTRIPGRRATPAIIGFLADLAPIAVIRGCGKSGGGSSIDNTLRFANPGTSSEWVLAQIDPQFAVGGYANGSVHLWSESGELLGTASQTSYVQIWD